jgi:hypothetical protein
MVQVDLGCIAAANGKGGVHKEEPQVCVASKAVLSLKHLLQSDAVLGRDRAPPLLLLFFLCCC